MRMFAVESTRAMEVHAWVCAHQTATLVEARSFKFQRALATGHGDERRGRSDSKDCKLHSRRTMQRETTMEARTDSDNFRVRMQQ